MTTKERLIDLVEHLDDAQAAEALELLAARYPQSARSGDLPAFVGMGHSGRGDLARRAKEIIRREFGGHGA